MPGLLFLAMPGLLLSKWLLNSSLLARNPGELFEKAEEGSLRMLESMGLFVRDDALPPDGEGDGKTGQVSVPRRRFRRFFPEEKLSWKLSRIAKDSVMHGSCAEMFWNVRVPV
jgi:hypothetical protein